MSASTTRYMIELRAKPLPGQGVNPIVTIVPMDALSLQQVQRQAEASVLAGVAEEVYIYVQVRQVTRAVAAHVREIEPHGLKELPAPAPATHGEGES